MPSARTNEVLQGLERAALAMVVVGAEGRVRYANPATLSLFGPVSEMILSDPPPCDDPRSPLAALLGLWEDSRNSPESDPTVIVRCKVDGASVFLWSQSVLLGQATPGDRLFLFLDLTRHMIGSEPVRRLVSQLAHDLRSPLTSISGATELLLSGRVGKLAGVQEKLLRIVDEGAGKMAGIITRVSEEGREGESAS